MNKNELRKKYRIIRKEIDNKSEQNVYIFNHVINNTHINKNSTILLYVSFNDEVDTLKLINYFLTRNKVAVPKVINDKMDFYYINSINDLKPGYFGILEPITNKKVVSFDNSICIVPGICFDINNYRIGYGKGFYDKFLCNKKCIYKIGLAFKECIVEDTFHDEFDIQLDEVIYYK